MGMEAEEFLKSDLGRYMVGRAKQEGEKAALELSRVSPWRRRRIQQLQNEIKWASSFNEWLASLINSGRGAAATYDQIVAEAQENPDGDRLAEHTGERNDD